MEVVASAYPVVVVLGFHRSGTSMVTRMLNLLGVDLGDEAQLLPPEEHDNARGYWEPRWMIDLNEEILAALGSGTFEPFRPDSDWHRSPALEPLRQRARALLGEHFAGRARWGWKDPRTSLTLPFWRELVDAPLRCIVCVRSPADAVASALKRGVPGIDRWQYAERWLDYVASALDATAPAERLLVFYEDALREPAAEARRLARFLGLDEPDAATLEPIASSVDPELRHHRSSAWDVAVDEGIPLETRALYLQLRARRRLEDRTEDDGASAERLETALEQIAAAQRWARWEAADAVRRVADAERAADRMGEAEQAAAARNAELVREVERLKLEAGELRGALNARDAAITTITASKSWRLTRPLRALGGRLRRSA